MINDIEVKESKKPTNLLEIEKFEELIQAKLPEDYKKFLLKHNGGHPTVNVYKLIEPINERNKEASISWFFALYDGEYSNITTEFKYSREKIPDELLPIARDDGGNIICLGIQGDYYGKLYYWTTNYSFWGEEDLNYIYLISNSFTDFINGLYSGEYDGKGNFIRKYQDGKITVTAE